MPHMSKPSARISGKQNLLELLGLSFTGLIDYCIAFSLTVSIYRARRSALGLSCSDSDAVSRTILHGSCMTVA